MNNKTRRKSLAIGVHVISVTCPCGGMCENERGSTMIEEGEIVWCLDCKQRYEITPNAFKKSRQSISEDK
jgi:hypothetical protein